MYLEYYGLKEPPFDLTPNPRFLFFSAKHREAFNHLLYGIRERKGFVQLTGEVGAGKTTICRAMLGALGDAWATALIFNPPADPDLLLKSVAIFTRRWQTSKAVIGLRSQHWHKTSRTRARGWPRSIHSRAPVTPSRRPSCWISLIAAPLS